jgi:transposase
MQSDAASVLADPRHGLTVSDVAKRYRVGEDKVRTWIARGELKAVNTAAVLAGRPRWVVTRDALAAFERLRAGGPTTKQQRRRRRQPGAIDFFPDAVGE